MSMQWFGALSGFEFAMRVDEDVCIMQLPVQLPALLSGLDYGFGIQTTESHQETLDTFNSWLDDRLTITGIKPTIPPLPSDRIFFTNFFASRVNWWQRPDVAAFLGAVNRTGGVYFHRWGGVLLRMLGLLPVHWLTSQHAAHSRTK